MIQGIVETLPPVRLYIHQILTNLIFCTFTELSFQTAIIGTYLLDVYYKMGCLLTE